MNKKTLIIFALFICGCTPQALPNRLPQLISSGDNNQSNVSASPTISTSVSPSSTVTPQISPTALSTSSPDISNSSNPNTNSSPNNINNSASATPVGTIKINVPVNYANSYLASQAKSVTVIITDDTGKISTVTLSSSGGDIVIPVNTKTITLNALDSSNRVISTITQNVNFSNNTNTNIVLQANFSNSVNTSGNSGGSGFSGGSSGGGAPPNPDIPVNATVRPDNTSVK